GEARALLGLGRVSLGRGDFREAQRLLERSAALAPRSRSTHQLLAEVYHRLGNRAAAERQRLVLRDLPEVMRWPDQFMVLNDGIRSERGLTDRARELRKAARYEEARAVLEGSLRRHPHSFSLHLELGRVNLRLEKLEASVRVYQEAARLAPDRFEATY